MEDHSTRDGLEWDTLGVFFPHRLDDYFYIGQSPDVHNPKGRNPRPLSPLTALEVDWGQPSPLRALSADWLSMDAANACVAACVRMADHRAMREATTVCRKGAGVSRALVWARSRRKVVASGLQRPPASMARTTSRHLLDPTSSGYVRSLFCRAVCKAAPAYWPPRRRGCAAPARGETRVVSMANWEPCHNRSPVAMTSMVRSSALATRVCMVTRAPASRIMPHVFGVRTVPQSNKGEASVGIRGVAKSLQHAGTRDGIVRANAIYGQDRA